MPVYKTLYYGSFLNTESTISNSSNQKLVEVYIYDTESGLGAVESTIGLDMADEPVFFEIVNNAEDKFNVVNSSSAEIKLHTTSLINNDFFSEGADRRWYVEIYYSSQIKFIGWLSISDIPQDFMPNPNVLILTANDGLGSAADEPLVDFDGVNPRWENRIIEYTAWALNQGTGLQLNMVFSFNIREEFATTITSDDSGDTHFVKWIWLLAKTFEDDINTSISCLDILRDIYGDMVRVSQINGKWYFNSVDELETRDLYLFEFDYQGTFVSKTTYDPSKNIGASELCGWMNDDCQKNNVRAVKRVIEKFEFRNPKETLTNYDLSRGEDLTATTIDPEGWILERNYPVIIPTSTPGYIETVSVDDQETERYLHIAVSATNFYHAWRNLDKIYIEGGDKIDISVDWRHDANEGGSGHYHLPVAMVRLWGDDGTHWHMNIAGGYNSSDPTSYWIQSNAAWTTNARYLYHDGEFAQDDLSQWQSASGISAPCPVAGMVEVFLIHNFKSNERGKSFAAISFEIIPYDKGTYAKYKGQQFSIEQALNTVGKREGEAKISDATKRNRKGTLLKVGTPIEKFTGVVVFSGTNSMTLPAASGYYNYLFTIGKKITTTGTNQGYYTIEDIIYSVVGDRTEIIIKENNLTTVTESCTINELGFIQANSFYSAAPFPDGVPDETYYHPYGHLQLYNIWNQVNRNMKAFEGVVDRLDSGTDIPDVFRIYNLTDASLATTGKKFIALHLSQDTHLCETDIFLHEVFDENIPKDYTEDELDFKYYT